MSEVYFVDPGPPYSSFPRNWTWEMVRPATSRWRHGRCSHLKTTPGWPGTVEGEPTIHRAFPPLAKSKVVDVGPDMQPIQYSPAGRMSVSWVGEGLETTVERSDSMEGPSVAVETMPSYPTMKKPPLVAYVPYPETVRRK